MGLKEIILASALLLPSTLHSDYLAQINMNNKEVVVAKDDEDMCMIIESSESIKEKKYRAVLEEMKENMANENSGLNNSMLELLGTPYSSGREGRGKMSAIFGEKIPIEAFVYYNANPKLFVLNEGREIGNISSKEIEKGDKMLSGMPPLYYSLYFNNWTDFISRIKAASKLTKDIKELTEIKFLFTTDEISDIKNDLKRWNIKDLEQMARVKFEILKQASKAGEKEIRIKDTNAYKEYLKSISKKPKTNLDNLLEKYETKITPVEILKNDISQMTMVSEYNLKEIEKINLEIKLEKTRINENKSSYRLWTFSKDWKSEKSGINEYYVLKFPCSLLICHPKDSKIGNLVQKSYNVYSEGNKMNGKWMTDFAEDKNNKIVIKDKARDYAMDTAISNLIKGYIIKTKNISEWIYWKISEDIGQKWENRKNDLIEILGNDYILTEIVICPSDSDITAKYFGFSITETGKDVYIFEKVRVENGLLQNRSFGESEKFMLVKEGIGKNECSKDLNADNLKGSFNDLEIEKYLDERKDMYFSANSNALEFEVLGYKRLDKDDAEATIRTVNDFYNQSFLKTRYTETEKLYLKKTDGKWGLLKQEKISSESQIVP